MDLQSASIASARCKAIRLFSSNKQQQNRPQQPPTTAATTTAHDAPSEDDEGAGTAESAASGSSVDSSLVPTPSDHDVELSSNIDGESVSETDGDGVGLSVIPEIVFMEKECGNDNPTDLEGVSEHLRSHRH